MEVTVIKGKRENSEHFFIRALDQIYSKKSKSNGNVLFVECFHHETGCKARGKIDTLGFHSSEGINSEHSNHEYTTTSVVNYLACYNELKVQARTSGKMPNVLYDEVMAKYEGMFDQILTFPSVQATLLKCGKEYFPRFPQTAAEFFAAFEQESVFRRYGHCFEEIFFHGVIGNEADVAYFIPSDYLNILILLNMKLRHMGMQLLNINHFISTNSSLFILKSEIIHFRHYCVNLQNNVISATEFSVEQFPGNKDLLSNSKVVLLRNKLLRVQSTIERLITNTLHYTLLRRKGIIES